MNTPLFHRLSYADTPGWMLAQMAVRSPVRASGATIPSYKSGMEMDQELLTRVVESIAKTTRYPTELLTADADLENDLGIDSVKRLEIVVALSDEFDVRLDLEERDPSIRTIQNVADWVDRIKNGAVAGSTNGAENSAQHLLPVQQADASSQTVHAGSSHGAFMDRGPVPVRAPVQEWAKPVAPVSAPNPNPSVNHVTHSPATSGPPAPHFDGATDPELSPVTRNLSGRVALVTGSGHGVGRATARVLASRGATVIVNSFHSRELGEQTASEINARGGSAIHLWGSVTNSNHVDDIFSQIESQFGRLDMLICNASDGRIGPFMDLTADDWDRAFRTNVMGHHQCTVKAAPLMQRGGGGSIITMSAVGAHRYIEGLGSQGVVKAAVETMTRYLACELGQFGIRVNCVSGGPVYGELLSKFPNARATQNHWESITPDGELCSPLDLANAIAFLVSDEARGINGSVWMVDHGFSAIADGRPVRFAAKDNAMSAT